MCLFLNVVCAQTTALEQDALQLAARLSETENSPFIAEDLSFQFQDALQAVASSDLLAAKLVTKKYNIQTSNLSSFNTVDLIVSPTSLWLKKLNNNQFKLLVARYNLNIQQFEKDGFVTVRLNSKVALNMSFIAKEFSMIDDVIMVELPTETLLKNDISSKAAKNGLVLTYTLRNNFYTAGTFKAHIWEFMVADNGDVTLLREYGDKLSEIEATFALASTTK